MRPDGVLASPATPAIEQADLRRLVGELSEISRPSASEGEREAAEWVAARMGELGVRARIETERAHSGYWAPLGALTAIGAAGAVIGRRHRLLGTALAGAAAAGIWDDVSAGPHVFRSALPNRTAVNVVGEVGDPDADRIIVLVAHHDAARSGLIF